MRIPLTICGFHLQFADSADSCGFCNSSTQLYTCLIICLWIPQTVLDSAKTVADSANSPSFWSDLENYNVLGICLWKPKQQIRSKKCSNVAHSATYLISACCGIRLQTTECTFWPRNVEKKLRKKHPHLYKRLNYVHPLFEKIEEP